MDYEVAVEDWLNRLEAPPLSMPPRLAALDAQLASMSGEAFIDQHWTTAALSTSDGWVVVRRLAADVLEEMGWKAEVPGPDSGVVYVLGPNSSDKARTAE